MLKDEEIKKFIEGKVIMVTGGTGSFGNAVVKKLLPLNPKQIIVYSRDEKKQFDMANAFVNSGDKLRFFIGDVRDATRVNYIMKMVDIVFQAAALKQVPNCEFFPIEALMTNTVGVHNVVSSAAHHDVERVVVLSTDKACYPVNVMGMTKALSERVMIAQSREHEGRTAFCATRYGNVMYTRGSVIPFLVGLIKQGKPVLVTNPAMTRFMMPLEESVDLVLYAMAHGKSGEIYVRKSPAVTIGNLTKAIADLFSYDKEIKEIGTRPGEKLHETLITSEEAGRVEDCGEYYKINPEVPKMDMKKYYFNSAEKGSIIPSDGYTSANTRLLTLAETKEMLLALPEIQEELKDWKKS